MYYSNSNFKLFNINNIKNIILLILLALCIFFLLKGNKNSTFNKERIELNKDIKSLQSKYDSLNKVSVDLQNQYSILQENSVKDSIVVDSLGVLIDNQNDIINKANSKANFYSGKYNALNKTISNLEKNKNYKKGDNLLESLSKNIN